MDAGGGGCHGDTWALLAAPKPAAAKAMSVPVKPTCSWAGRATACRVVDVYGARTPSTQVDAVVRRAGSPGTACAREQFRTPATGPSSWTRKRSQHTLPAAKSYLSGGAATTEPSLPARAMLSEGTARRQVAGAEPGFETWKGMRMGALSPGDTRSSKFKGCTSTAGASTATKSGKEKTSPPAGVVMLMRYTKTPW